METIRAELRSTSVLEWDAEDEVSGVLSDDTPVVGDENAARAMLYELVVNIAAHARLNRTRPLRS